MQEEIFPGAYIKQQTSFTNFSRFKEISLEHFRKDLYPGNGSRKLLSPQFFSPFAGSSS